MESFRPLIVILGPTAVGKTEIAVAAAERLNAEIISADSRTFYKGMDIGTAKPSLEQRRRVKHYLVDTCDPDEEWTVVKFISEARRIIKDIHERGKIPFLVGGTGQYIKALVEGWTPPPRGKDDSIRQKFSKYAQEHGGDSLHKRLASVDPESAARIPATNLRRVVRALEIYEITGVPASEQRRKSHPDYQVLQIGLQMSREALYQRIDDRIDRMMEEGLVGEVEALLEKGFSLELPSMSAIGYLQVGKALQGQNSIEGAVMEMRKLSRQLVRRQANWFKPDDPHIHWLEVGHGINNAVIALVSDFVQDLDEIPRTSN